MRGIVLHNNHVLDITQNRKSRAIGILLARKFGPSRPMSTGLHPPFLKIRASIYLRPAGRRLSRHVNFIFCFSTNKPPWQNTLTTILFSRGIFAELLQFAVFSASTSFCIAIRLSSASVILFSSAGGIVARDSRHFCLILSGEPSRTRTCDPLVKSQFQRY